MFNTFYSEGISHTVYVYMIKYWTVHCVLEGVTGRTLMVVLILANSTDPDEMLHSAAFHLGQHCLSKYLVILLLWIICVIYVLCLSCFHVRSLLPCGHLKGKG